MKTPKALTLETSFFGYDCDGNHKHFSSLDIKTIGSNLLYAMYLAHAKHSLPQHGLDFTTVEN
jgi:hypothetical protein